jgi:hypothetical protein
VDLAPKSFSANRYLSMRSLLGSVFGLGVVTGGLLAGLGWWIWSKSKDEDDDVEVCEVRPNAPGAKQRVLRGPSGNFAVRKAIVQIPMPRTQIDLSSKAGVAYFARLLLNDNRFEEVATYLYQKAAMWSEQQLGTMYLRSDFEDELVTAVKTNGGTASAFGTQHQISPLWHVVAPVLWNTALAPAETLPRQHLHPPTPRRVPNGTSPHIPWAYGSAKTGPVGPCI